MFFRPMLSCALGALCALLAADARAIGEREGVTDYEAPPGLATQTAPALHGGLELSLAEAIAMGLENNLDVEVQRHAPLIRGEDRRIARGAFDPESFFEFGYVANDTPVANALVTITPGAAPASPFTIQETSQLDGFGGFRGLFPLLGTEYDLRFSGGREDNSANFFALDPQLTSGFALSFTQPLLRGLIWNEPWTQVKTTKVQHLSALEQFRADIMDTVSGIENAYWAVVADGDAVGVARKSLETALALLDQTQVEYDVGVKSKVEVVEAEAGVAEREVQLIRAENEYENTQDRLINIILGPGLRADTTLQIRPSDRPGDYIVYEIDVESAVALAFQYRPELQVAQKEIERNEIQLKFAKNQRLPALDARVTWGRRGLAGALKPGFQFANPTVEPTPWEDNFDLYDNSNELTARALFSIPIPNTRARAQVSKTALELRRAQVQKRRVEQDIILEVRKAARDLESAQEAIEGAERRRIASEEQLRAERIRLEYGESTPFDVLLKERDLADAENQKIRALQTYRDSQTGLDRAQGTILRSRNVRIDQVRGLR